MKHWASSHFWDLYSALPPKVRSTADKNFLLLKADSRHPSLHFKRIGDVWSVRVGEGYRALAHDVPGGIKWFWIGPHAEYEKIGASCGRDAGYPAPPAQTPACSFSAPGSSVALASVMQMERISTSPP